MDADGRFVVGSDEFIELVGPRTTAAFGRLWSEIAAELKLDPENQVARAVETQETWSGITLSWPVDETSERLPTELSGLPVFDRDRKFRGYRGFGVCRDITRINALSRVRHERPIGLVAAADAPSTADGIASPAPPGPTPIDSETAPPQSPPPEARTRVERPALSLAPAAAANVVPFRPGPPSEPKTPSLSAVERKAFRELAQELTARLRGTQEGAAVTDDSVIGQNAAAEAASAEAKIVHAPSAAATPPSRAVAAADANTAGDAAVAAVPPGAAADMHRAPSFEASLLDRIPIGVMIYRHDALIFANRHFLDWTGYDSAEALQSAGGLNALFVEPGAAVAPQTLTENAGAQPLSITTRRGDRLPVEGRLFTISWNGASALALIVVNGAGADRARATEQGLAAAENEVRTLKALLEGETQTREKSEQELRNAKREAQKAAATKTEFVAKISHEIRTPLNAIVGFAEVIMAERFGPIGNERYREYLKDIHAAGIHLVSLLNDLLDLTKIETGRLDLAFVNVTINDLISQCVAIMQPPANRARIIIRTALAPGLPDVVADERSLRQIVLNLLANSVRFTGPGGQVIVSTALSDSHQVVLRVRDTGVGMSEQDIEAALEPFRQTAISGSWGSGGTGLGLPLTKALTEANRAHFSIKSAPSAGTLVEVAFPPSRLAAE
jgi:signal transduction histidine kinase